MSYSLRCFAVVVQDVAPAETFGSVAAALKALSVTADVIFSRVENRVADERARLAAINARITRAKTRIQSMAGELIIVWLLWHRSPRTRTFQTFMCSALVCFP